MNYKIIKSKKASALPLYVSLFIVFSFLTILIFGPVLKGDKAPIGQNPYAILSANQKTENIRYYMQESLKYSSNTVKNEFESKIASMKNEFSCGTHTHIITMGEEGYCGPDYEKIFKDLIDENFYQYLSIYDSLRLFTYQYYVTLSQDDVKLLDKEKSYLNIKLIPKLDSEIKVPIAFETDNLKKEEIFYPSGPYGTCGNEIIKPCDSNECIADTAKSFYDLYALSNLKFNYVWGGESPYTYEDTIEGGSCSEFFKGVSVSFKEPGRQKLTQRGFDCSGFVWWVGKHADVKELGNVRLSANDYYIDAKKENKLIWEKTTTSFTKENMLEILKPGDVLFSKAKDDSEITHVMIYFGDSQIIHSKSTSGLSFEEISSNLLSNVQAVARYLPVKTTEEAQTNTAENSEELENEKQCYIPNFYAGFVDVNLIQTNGIPSRPSPQEQAQVIEELYDSLQTIDSKKLNNVISEYSKKEGVDESFVRAIIATETGEKYLKQYITKSPNDDKCNEMGYCGLMQVGTSACKDVDSLNANSCNFNLVKKDLIYGIEKGISYIKILSTNPTYKKCYEGRLPIDYQNDEELNKLLFIDYYFLALSYNAGPGSCTEIKKAAILRNNPTKNRNEISDDDLRLLRWGDVRKEDVKAGMTYLYNSRGKKPEDAWMVTEAKFEEIIRYPNLVGNALSQQCDGDLSLIYNTGYIDSENYIKMNPVVQTKIEFDLDKYLLLRNFMEKLSKDCENKNKISCISNAIKSQTFNKFAFFHLSDYTKIEEYNYYVLENTFLENVQETLNTGWEIFKNSLTNEGELNLDARDVNSGDEFRDHIVDQMVDCYKNEQTNCVCPINFDWNKLNETKIFTIIKDSDGRFVVQSKESFMNMDLQIDNSEDVYIPFNPLLLTNGEKTISNNVKLRFEFEKDDERIKIIPTFYSVMVEGDEFPTYLTLGVDASDVLTVYDELDWVVEDINNSPISLYKNASGDLSWYHYQNLDTDPPQCMDRKIYYRFVAYDLDGKENKFSIYLNDTTLPVIDKNKLKTESQELKCLNKKSIFLKWSNVFPDESLFAFKIFVIDPSTQKISSSVASIYNAIHFDPANIDMNFKVNTLYYDNSTKTFYYPTYKIGDIEFEYDKTYSFAISGVDQFNLSQDNIEGLTEISFNIKKPQEIETIKTIIKGIIPGSDQIPEEDLLNGFCYANVLGGEVFNSMSSFGIVCCNDYIKPTIKFSEGDFDD